MADIESLGIAELEEYKKVNAETFVNLKKEIEVLKWKLNQYGPRPDILLSQNSSTSISARKEKIRKETEHHQRKLQKTQSLTGVVINSFKKDVSFKDETHCEAEYNLEITVLDRQVRLACTTEKDFGANPQTEKVTVFQIWFKEDIHNAIGEQITLAAEKVELQSAFGLIKSYLTWKRNRNEIVARMSEANPENISIFTSEDGSFCLRISNNNSDRPVFNVEWGRKTSGDKIVADVHLRVDAPERWLSMDTAGVLQSAPQMFDKMVTTLSLEKALDTVVQLVKSDGQHPKRISQ